jgi:5-oxopent-3-ene-1,2,5-tricarboxylate decarboxylase/2-hydroxyhepta-2,4-diene-1,7-dioate isomerase
LDHVAGYLIVADVSVPHDSYHRPSIRYKARDGYCPLGPAVVGRAALGSPDALTIRTYLDGALLQTASTADLIRPAARLLADVTEFMTLSPGDVLALGAAAPAPRVRSGQTVTIELDGLGSLSNPYLAGACRMMRARVAYAGAIHEAFPAPQRRPDAEALLLEDGRVVAAGDVVWLPPFAAGTIVALGLNYADHAKELAFNAQDEPLVFLKGPGTLLGHRGVTRRPAGVKFMHYECELAVVIGRKAKKSPRAHALQHVAGYCIANDYAIRDYLENWYRPNLRVKNRDGATVLGPWLVDAADVADPGNLGLRTFVNGKLTQQGNTRDLIYDIPYLIEYLSEFMTLVARRCHSHGNSRGRGQCGARRRRGLRNRRLGRLVNTIAADAEFGR